MGCLPPINWCRISLAHPQHLFFEMVVTLCLFSMGIQGPFSSVIYRKKTDDFHSYVSLPGANLKVNLPFWMQISGCGGDWLPSNFMKVLRCGKK